MPDSNGALSRAFDETNRAIRVSGSGTSVDDTAYDATSWNGVTTIAPSKNAVRDKFESLTSVPGLNLTRTAVKVANYNAAAGDLVPCDTSGGNFTVTLPTAPADKTTIEVKMVIGGGVVTIAAGGSDVFNKAAGSTSLTLTITNQAVTLQYDSSTAIWTVMADDLPTMVRIAQIVLAAPAATLDFSSIPATFESLRLVVMGATDRASTGDDVKMLINNDSGANYNTEKIICNDTTLASAGVAAASAATIGQFAAASSPAGRASLVEVLIPNYARTTFQKNWQARGGGGNTDAANGQIIQIWQGVWRNTAAITRVTFLPNLGTNFATGTVATLWGVL